MSATADIPPTIITDANQSTIPAVQSTVAATPSSTTTVQSSVVPRFQVSLELASKATASLAILISVCGFLVTSLSDSTFGFIQMNPFRPRTLAAGAWFLVALAIPMTVAASYAGWKRPSWKELAAALYPFCVACQFFSFGLSRYFLTDYSVSYDSSSPVPFHWKSKVVFVVFFGILIALITSKRIPQWLSSSASIAFAIWFVFTDVWQLYPDGFDPLPAISLWLIVIGIVTAIMLKGLIWRFQKWVDFLFLFLVALGVFGRTFYPHLDSAMGGGSPIPVTIFFSKESPILASQTKAAYLVDESDAGYYVLGKGDKKAAFVPRADVSLVFFSDDLKTFSLSHEK